MEKTKKHVVDRYDLKLLIYDYKLLSQCYEHANIIFNGDLTHYFDEGVRSDPEFKYKIYSFLSQLSHCIDALDNITYELDSELPYDDD